MNPLRRARATAAATTPPPPAPVVRPPRCTPSAAPAPPPIFRLAYLVGGLVVAAPIAGLGLWFAGVVPFLVAARGVAAVACGALLVPLAGSVFAGLRVTKLRPSDVVGAAYLAKPAAAGSLVVIRRDHSHVVLPPPAAMAAEGPVQ